MPTRIKTIGDVEYINIAAPKEALDALISRLDEKTNAYMVDSEQRGNVRHDPMPRIYPVMLGEHPYFYGIVTIPYYNPDDDDDEDMALSYTDLPKETNKSQRDLWGAWGAPPRTPLEDPFVPDFPDE